MRIEMVPKEVYTLDEVREKAVDKNWDINVDYDWWDGVYYDAEMIKLKITGFDIDRGAYCHGTFLAGAATVAGSILQNHGTACDTYRLASRFLFAISPLQSFLDRIGASDRLYKRESIYRKYREAEKEIEILSEEFERDLLEEYRCILQREYEYLTSAEAIYETLAANGYEFNADGTIY